MKNPLIALLSILLCFCLLAKQADVVQSADLDLAALVDVPEIEADSRCDYNEPMLAVIVPPPMSGNTSFAAPTPDIHYRQPQLPPDLRPPVV